MRKDKLQEQLPLSHVLTFISHLTPMVNLLPIFVTKQDFNIAIINAKRKQSNQAVQNSKY